MRTESESRSGELESVVHDLDALTQVEPRERMLRTADLAERLQDALADGQTLATVARRVARFASDHGCDVIMGASPIGERVAGAAVAVSGNGVRGSSRADSGAQVLVVDGLYVTGSQIERTIENVMAHRPVSVSAAALLSAVSHPQLETDPPTPVSVIGV